MDLNEYLNENVNTHIQGSGQLTGNFAQRNELADMEMTINQVPNAT